VSVLQGFFVVAPLRGLTEPGYQLQQAPGQEFTPRGSAVEMGRTLASNLMYNKRNVRVISEWESEIVGAHLEIDAVPGVQVTIKNPDKDTDYVNEGFGSNQLLFVLERIANSPPDSVIGVEEPEIYLHPKAQFNLGRWVARIVPKLNKQLIILTHSPDMISGILSGVKREELKPEDVSIWFFERKDHEILATPSRVDAEGKVTGPAIKS